MSIFNKNKFKIDGIFKRYATSQDCKKRACPGMDDPSDPQDCLDKKPTKPCEPPSPSVQWVDPKHIGGFKKFRTLTFLVALPIVIFVGVTVYMKKSKEEVVRPPFVPYEYMRIRSKRFPWGDDGMKSLFHNPHVNALPDGYEDEHDD